MGHYSEKYLQQLEFGKGKILDGDTPLFNIKSFLEAGGRIFGGYPGSPVAATLDAAIDARDILKNYGAYLDESNEAGTTASSWPSVVADIRSMIVYKIVGVNVASDVLAHIGSTGVRGGLVIIVGEDPGCDSTIVAQKCLPDAWKFGFPLLVPNYDAEHLHEITLWAFSLSEATRDESGYGGTPVFVAQTTATANLRGRIRCYDNVPPTGARVPIQVVTERTPMIPYCRDQEREKTDRLYRAQNFIRSHNLNRVVRGWDTTTAFITYGQVYNSLMRALHFMGDADLSGSSRYSVLNLAALHPLLPDQIADFCRSFEKVVVVEEGFPAMLEPSIKAILYDCGLHVKVLGKELFPNHGELKPRQIEEALRKEKEVISESPSRTSIYVPTKYSIKARFPGFCSGCPEAPVASGLKLIKERHSDLQLFFAGDIGCYTMLGYPPYEELKNSLVSMGNGVNAIKAFSTLAPQQKAICFMGDGTFWHSGLNNSVVSGHFSQANAVLVIFENETTAMTGHEPNPSTGENYKGKTHRGSIEDVIRGVGVKWVRRVKSEDKAVVFRECMAAIEQALLFDEPGLKVVIDASRCELYGGRIRRKEEEKILQTGGRLETVRKLVDPTVCIGDHGCMKLVGCPSLTVTPSKNPLRRGETIAATLQSCTGLGHCQAAAKEAELCPSFVEAIKVTNPSFLEKFVWRVRRAVLESVLYGKN